MNFEVEIYVSLLLFFNLFWCEKFNAKLIKNKILIAVIENVEHKRIAKFICLLKLFSTSKVFR